jgi:hypothetical protein
MQIFPSNKSDHPLSDRKNLHTDPNYKMLFWQKKSRPLFASESRSADPYLLLADPDPVLFVSGPDDANKKLLNKLFLFITSRMYTYIILSSKIKKESRSHQTVKIKVLLTIFAWWWKDPDLYIWLTDLDPRGPKTYGSWNKIMDPKT